LDWDVQNVLGKNDFENPQVKKGVYKEFIESKMFFKKSPIPIYFSIFVRFPSLIIYQGTSLG